MISSFVNSIGNIIFIVHNVNHHYALPRNRRLHWYIAFIVHYTVTRLLWKLFRRVYIFLQTYLILAFENYRPQLCWLAHYFANLVPTGSCSFNVLLLFTHVDDSYMINEIIILDCTFYRDALIHLRCYLTFKLVLIMRYKYYHVYEMIIGDKYKKCGIWSFIMCKSITNDRYQFKKVIIKLFNYKVSMFFEIYLRVFLSILFFFYSIWTVT